MRTSKRKLIIIFLVIVMVFVGIKLCSVVFDSIGNRIGEIFCAQVHDVITEASREDAIMTLCEIRGNVKQLNKLYNSSKISESLVVSELTYISFFQDSINPYLKDFSITITSSDVGEICKEILLQVENQISNIRFGSQGE